MTSQTVSSTLPRRVNKAIVSGLFTQALTVALGLAIVPYMVRKLGNDGYALLSFSLAMVGYMAFIDLGLSNSMVRFLAEYDGRGDSGSKEDVLATGICAYPVLGLFFGTIVAVLTPYLVTRILTLPVELHGVALIAFYITAVGFPIVFIKAYFESIPTAHQRISTLNGVNLTINGGKLLCSALLLYFGYGLVAVITANVLITVLHIVILIWLSMDCLPPGFRFRFRLKKSVLKALLTNGLFVSVSNLSNLVTLNLDKWLIAAFLPISTLAYYVVAYELAGKLWYIPTQINRAHFPFFGYLWGRRDLELMRHNFQQSVRQIVLGITFIAAFVIFYARPILRFWMGPDYAEAGAGPLQMLTLGTLMNCWSIAPYSLLVAIDRARTSARIRFLTMILNTTLCVVLIPRFGITGAAFAFFVGYLVDAVLLYWVVQRVLFPGTLWWLVRQVIVPSGLISAATLGLVYALTRVSVTGMVSLITVCSAAYAIYLAATYFLILSEPERHSVRSLFMPVSRTGAEAIR